jgi:CO dehydrogenase/acetyl-CoA synthase delta subunit
VNAQKLPNSLLKKYEDEGAYPVETDKEKVKRLGVKIVKANIINTHDYIRHNSKRLAKIILDIVSSVF